MWYEDLTPWTNVLDPNALAIGYSYEAWECWYTYAYFGRPLYMMDWEDFMELIYL